MDFVNKFIKDHPLQKINVCGAEHEYIVGGKGKVGFLVFPGSGQDLYSCYDFIDYFENKYKVIAVELSGFYDLNTFFKYVNSILNREKIESVILYGLSIGGFIAQHYVKRFPHKVTHLILSHTGSTKSKTVIRHIIIPGKIIFFFLRFVPLSWFKKLLRKNAGRVQSGSTNVRGLYQKYSSQTNYARRSAMSRKIDWDWLTKSYLWSIYYLGLQIHRFEKESFVTNNFGNWPGKILIIRSDNDPLAQDDGMFKHYYPKAKVVTFHKTGHLTAFIQFNKMVNTIDNFIQ